MASLQQLEQAFIKADDAAQAGDPQAREDAAVFAAEIKRMRGATPPQSGGFDQFKSMVDQGQIGMPTANYPHQAAMGVAEGLMGLAELPGTMRDLTQRGAKWAAGKMGASQQYLQNMDAGFAAQNAIGPFGGAPSAGTIKPMVEKVTGPFREPQNGTEGLVRRGGQFAPGVLMGPGGMAPKAGAWVGATLGSEAGKRLGDAVYPPGSPYMEFAGGLLGGAGGLKAAEKSATKAATKEAINNVPTTAQIQETAKQLYKQADDIGLAVKPQGYSDMIDDVFRAAGDDGFFPANHKGLANAFDELEKWRGSPMTLDKLQQLRRNIKSAYDKDNPQQNEVMQTALNKFDDYMENLRPDQVLNGETRAAHILLKEANPTWAKFKRSELFDNITQNAKNAVSANYTEAGFLTAIKQQLRAVAKDDFKRFKYLSPAERKMILEVMEGSTAEKVTRKLGKYSLLTGGGPVRVGGLGLIASFIPGVGPAIATGIGAGLGVAGTVARPISQSIARDSFNLLKATVRNGKPVRPLSSPSLIRSQVPIQGLLGLRAGQPGGGGGGQGY